MGILDSLKGNHIYVDSNIWIYTLENVSDYSHSIEALFNAVDTGILTLATSELSLAEILVRPIKEKNTFEQEAYEEVIKDTNALSVIPVERSVLIQAAKIRSGTKLKLPDAIHAASALSAGCTTFLTNDKQFRTVPALHTRLLSQVSLNSDES